MYRRVPFVERAILMEALAFRSFDGDFSELFYVALGGLARKCPVDCECHLPFARRF
jgi:hypothetical protein